MRASRYFLMIGLGSALTAGAAAQAGLPEDLTELSLEALLDIEVTSVSKQAEALADAAAAVYVLTGDEIRRSGAQTLPEALRLVPGLHVARVDGQRWAISARGYNGDVADKLEVLIDGRSIYSPLFSGVFWDAQDVFMPDLERIEVIRGPAATLWGSNAVNGVINIVTKAAADTQGLLTYAGGGDELQSFAGVRYGDQIGEHGAWRAHLRHWERDAIRTTDAERAHDGMQMTHVGLRADWAPADHSQLTVIANGYQNGLQNFDPALNPNGDDNKQSGANLLARWSRLLDDGARLSLQLFWDHTERTQHGTFGEVRDTWDLQFQHARDWGARHRIVWGAGYRLSRDAQDNPPLIVFTPAERTVRSANIFVSDEIALRPDTDLILNARLEHNDFSDADIQPSIRLRHALNPRTTLWSKVSRALRLPNRLDADVLIPLPEVGARGNRDFQPEESWSYELGMRHVLRDNLIVDIATHFTAYDELRGVEPASAPDIPLIVNNYTAEASGVEITSQWQASPTLKLHLAYAYLNLDLEPQADTADVQTEAAENQAPRHQAWLRWDWDPSPRWQVGGQLRHVSALADFELPGYTELDLQIGWQWQPNWQLALTGQSLLNPSHREWGLASAVERSVFLTFTWTPGAL